MAAMPEQGVPPASAAEPAPEPASLYRSLLSAPTPCSIAAPFTAHVFACILSIGIFDAYQNETSVSAAIGLNRAEIEALTRNWLPAASAHIDLRAEPETAPFDDEEEQLQGLLTSHQADAAPESVWLTAIVTRRSMLDNHLWQDLGLFDRGDLNRLMSERYPVIAVRNASNMKWKKFLYRSLCEMEGFTLCTAPSCQECSDFDNCFGDESGESSLARIRRDLSRAV
ncbi:nitrogen fixation protein NifQ [Methylocella tundrae]|uniref:Nitrogen fixation protein NifQ n=1 Tax=Methylocella tundrae TaxID=227605 RepID=A0A4U8Z1P4_METTU|nr:nitrogen fixation protein NifQ [Methylocella tundrae]WPP06431.1 nitrogen fixation protein NifQ [Methylocella tundrae]VFU09225.1 Nitrogen fixation protein NifQ [Methylocella tundrae]